MRLLLLVVELPGRLARRCGVNFAFSKGSGDLVPDFGVRLDKRTGVDRPAMESQRGLGGDKARRFHLLGPQPISFPPIFALRLLG
jgi:hypothetical protein